MEDSILISPFQESIPGTRTYNFHTACEHILVSTCDTNPLDFTVTIDFTSTDLDMGRVGVRLSNKTIIIDEDLNVTVANFGGPVSVNGTTTVYAGNISITQGPAQVVIALQELGVLVTRVQDGENAVFVNVSRDDAIEVCGLCGTLDGTLLYSDRSTTATGMDIERFADSWRANPSDQFLREQTRDCGE